MDCPPARYTPSLEPHCPGIGRRSCVVPRRRLALARSPPSSQGASLLAPGTGLIRERTVEGHAPDG